MIRFFAAFAGFLLLGAAAPAAAQQAPDRAGMAAARELLAATDFFGQWIATADQTADATMATMMHGFEEQHGMPFPPGLDAELRRILHAHNAAVLDALRLNVIENAARIYARYFSADEIRELQRLQTNPVMLKFQRIAPQFVSEVSQLGMAEALRRQPELQRRIGQAVEAWLARNGEAPRT